MDNKGITAIVTESRGVEFRSRLEARWSEMFTLLSWPWEYEPIDLDGYIPDFVLTFPHKQMLVEVKPAMAGVVKLLWDARCTKFKNMAYGSQTEPAGMWGEE